MLSNVMDSLTCEELRQQVASLQKELQEQNAKLMILQASLENRQNLIFTENSALHGSELVAYTDLIRRYGHHLNRGVEGLLGFWRQVGGEHGWSNYCLSPDELSLLLSQDETPVIHLRVERKLNKSTHGACIDEADLCPFFCQVLSRLPKLKRVMITDSPISPFNWNSMQEIQNPFPELRYLMLWSTPVCTVDLLELTRRAPNIASREEDSKGGIRVNQSFLTDPSEDMALLERTNKICVYGQERLK